jgi:hypothetical protein
LILIEAEEIPAGWNTGWNPDNLQYILGYKEEPPVPSLSFRLLESELGYAVSMGDFEGNEIIIPSEYNELPVLEIDEYGFYVCTEISNISIPESIITIGSSAFVYCTSLTEIFIPSTVLNMGSNVFLNCDTNLVITVGEGFNTDNWSDNWNPDKLKVIWEGVAPSLEFSLINEGSAYSVSIGTFNGTVIDIPVEYNDLPVTMIANNGFVGCSDITNIKIPSSINRIGNNALSGCVGLTEIFIPINVEFMGSKVFYSCDLNMIIKCEALRQPDSWNHDWNPDGLTVKWAETSDKDIVVKYRTELYTNYPNPFNPTTKIEFGIKQSEFVVIEVFNLKGQKIKTLVKGNFEAGNHSIVWNGEDEVGRIVSSGIYFYRMQTNDYTSIKKMLLMK